ncbi:twin-arginine translocation signal domain-containing protein, partial [Methylobacterium crusticola]
MHRRDFLVGLASATAALAITRTAVAQPTPAGAIPTPVYLAMATKGGVFLENTARDAFAKTGNPRVK